MSGLLPDGYKCPKCEKKNVFNSWVYAHTHVQTIHTCACGAKNIIDNLECVGTEEAPRPPLRAK